MKCLEGKLCHYMFTLECYKKERPQMNNLTFYLTTEKEGQSEPKSRFDTVTIKTVILMERQTHINGTEISLIDPYKHVQVILRK